MCLLVLLLLPTGTPAAASNADSLVDAAANPTTILSLLLLALIFVAIGVLSTIRQYRTLTNRMSSNNHAEEEGGGGGEKSDSRSCQNLVKDLKALREEHRTNQSEVKAELRAEMDALRGLQSDMATQMVEIRSMVERLADAQQLQHVKED